MYVRVCGDEKNQDVRGGAVEEEGKSQEDKWDGKRISGSDEKEQLVTDTGQLASIA